VIYVSFVTKIPKKSVNTMSISSHRIFTRKLGQEASEKKKLSASTDHRVYNYFVALITNEPLMSGLTQILASQLVSAVQCQRPS